MKDEVVNTVFTDRLKVRARIHVITEEFEKVLDAHEVLGIELMAAYKNLLARNPDLQVILPERTQGQPDAVYKVARGAGLVVKQNPV